MGSNPVGVTTSSLIHIGGLAQLGEHLPYKQRVGGSIPSTSTIFSFRHKIDQLLILFDKFIKRQWLALTHKFC